MRLIFIFVCLVQFNFCAFAQIPSAPVALSGSSVMFSSFTANWNASAGASEYRLDVSDNNLFSSFLPGYEDLLITGILRSVLGLIPNTNYYYRIRAKNTNGTSNNSTVINVRTKLQPPQANGATQVNSSGFYVNWSEVPGATSYVVDVSTSNTFSTFVSYYNNFSTSQLTGATSTSGFVYSTITNGTTYYYRFRAINAFSTSDNSNVISVTTIPPPPVATSPTFLTTTSFGANWNIATGATEYRLDVSTNNSFSTFVSGYQDLAVTEGNSKDIKGLQPNTTYYYRIRAKNSTGVSGNSTTITAVTLLNPPVANDATSINGSSFYVNWGLVTGATSYVVDVSTSNTFSTFVSYYNNFSTSQLTGATSTSGLVYSSITNGTTYYYRFRAINSTSTSLSSNIKSVTTVPAPLGTLSYDNKTNNSFNVFWPSVTGATEYRLDVSTNSSFSSFLAGYQDLAVISNSQNIVGLATGTNYYVRVRSKNNSGVSSNSTTLNVSTFSYPAPQTTSATSITSSSFKANGIAVPGASYYGIDVSTTNSFTSFVGTYNNASFSLGGIISTGIVGGTTYYYRLRVNGGSSAYSNVTSVTTVPSSPVAAAATDISSISFTANWGTAVGATEYRLDVSDNSAFSSYVSGYQDLQVNGVGYNVTGLTANKNYYFRVRAKNGSGTSINSSTISLVTGLVGLPIANAATLLTSSSFTANWGNVPDATSYRLDVSVSSSFSNYVTGFQDLNVSGNSQVVNGLIPGTTYYYRVRAKNALATSSNSNKITVANISITSPTLGQYISLSGNITIQFTCPSYIVNGIVKVYKNTTEVYSNPNFYVFPGFDVVIPAGGFQSGDDYKVKIEDKYNASIYGWSESFRIREPQNFVMNTQVGKMGIKTDDDIYKALVTEKQVNYSFFDGLGRIMQNISFQGSPNQNDIIQAVSYDEFGREVNKYLPYSDGNSGWYKDNALKDPNTTFNSQPEMYQSGKQYNFYQITPKIATDSRPYSEILFESSPLDRPDKDYGPGSTWITNNKFVQHQYLSNVHGTGSSLNQEKVIAWIIDANGLPVRASFLSGYIETGGYYSSNQLFVKVTIDEQGNAVREYSNISGQTVLKKVQINSTTNLNSATDWALTYYLYDGLGNLRYVFQPELSKNIHNAADTYVVTSTDLINFAFQYKYDSRSRMTEKQVPGTGSVYMVYDNRDRLVLTQDANQRAGATNAIKYWTFTKYDQLNRPILTGIKDTTSVAQLTQADMQSVVDAYYSTASMTAKPWRKYGESFIGSSVTNTVNGYTNYSYPQTTSPGVLDANSYLTATYYDNYTFRNDWLGTYTYSNDGLTATVSTGTYNQFATENQQVIGQITGTKIKVLDGGLRGGYTWLKNINYYDDKYRVIQTQADNLKGGVDKVSTLYDFSGKIIQTKETHTEYDLTLATGGVSLIGNKLTALYGGWGSSGASSIQVLPASQDGWVEVLATETTTPRAFGLSDVNPDLSYISIKYSFMLMPNGILNVIENNGAPTTISGGYKSGDILTIERAGSVINYKRNGTVVKTTTGALTTQLFLDIAINSQGSIPGTFAAFRSSFSTSNHSVTRRFIYDHASRLLEVWHKVDTQPEVRITYNQYNELGQLIDKKLHSTQSDASDNKQSVDYRYNIRGWVTSINNSQLTDDHTTTNTNDDTGDLFGMNLLYEQSDASNLSSTGLYNGNISGMKWSNGLGLGDTKEIGYNFSYDAMNRLIHANSRKNKTNAWQTGSYSENNLSYDLNGNIKTLQRTGITSASSMVTIDNLTYSYGTTGNQLQYVQDNTTNTVDKTQGFNDGNAGTATDYTYDVNGNLTHDLNKGIGTSTADATNIIKYNFLNLPELVTKGGNQIQYIYDATGHKLTQTVNNVNTFKQTDYVGEFNYENDVLQFINHEEGRVMMSATNMLYNNSFSGSSSVTATDVTPTNATVVYYSNTTTGENYAKVTSNGTANGGLTQIGLTGTSAPLNYTVAAGNRYRIRMKGYRTTNPVYLQIKAGSTVLNSPGTPLPNSATTESWIEQIVTIPSGGTSMTVGIVWGTTVTNGEIMYINEVEVSQLITNATNEYQYFLKDHLGNTRLTFTTIPQTPTATTATLESTNATNEQNQFLRYKNARIVNHYLFDHTNGSSPSTVVGAAQRLSGQTNEIYGLAKSIAVMPGDVINMEVYAKYIDPTSTNRTAALNTLISQIAGGTAAAGTVVDGSTYTTSTTSFPFAGGQNGTPSSTGTGPKAYLNWLTFDKNYNLILSKSGYTRMTTAAKETGQDIAHEKLTGSVTIGDAGYVYIYLSNEEGVNPYEVYFDDFKVTQTKSAVIASNDYYPFGLTFNSYQRENSVENKIKFQGQEHIDDLGLNWDSFKWRNHQPDIGRFFNVDPLAAKYVYNSPYAFSENRVINGRELEGLEWVSSTGQQIYDPKANGGKGAYTEHATRNDKRLGNSLQGTTKGQEQFGKLVNANHPISIAVNMSDEIVKGPNGGLLAGKTENTRDSFIDLKTGKVDEVEVKKSDVVINVTTMEQLMEKGGTFSGEDVKGLTFDQFLGAVLGHEIEHTTDKNNIIDANKQDAEKPAHDVSREIIQETKKQNEDEKKK